MNRVPLSGVVVEMKGVVGDYRLSWITAEGYCDGLMCFKGMVKGS